MIKAFEKRIDRLQKDKIVVEEKISTCGHPVKPYEQMYRTSLQYLANPHKIWACGGFAEKRAVLKLTFTKSLVYDRKHEYRIPDLALPFKVLGGCLSGENIMVP